jgi:hypothetical protein
MTHPNPKLPVVCSLYQLLVYDLILELSTTVSSLSPLALLKKLVRSLSDGLSGKAFCSLPLRESFSHANCVSVV